MNEGLGMGLSVFDVILCSQCMQLKKKSCVIQEEEQSPSKINLSTLCQCIGVTGRMGSS